MKNKKQNILIFTCANIGDFVWATSAILLIKQTNKNCNLALITFDRYSSLIDKKLGIDDIFILKHKYYNSKNIFIKYIYKFTYHFFHYFKIKKYQTIIFLDQNKVWTLFVKYFYRIENIVGPNTDYCGFNIYNSSSKYFTQTITMPMDSDRVHMMMRYQIIIRIFLGTYNLSIPILPDTSNLKNKISMFIDSTKKYNIAICADGTVELRNWKIQYWEKLIIQLIQLEQNINFLITGFGDKQYKKALYLKNKIPNANIKNCVNKTTLLELKELLKYVNLLISVDTGTAHIAGTNFTPTITLHGMTLPEQSMPINHNSKQICLYKKCAPCNHKILYFNNICKNNICLEDITPNLVFDTIKQLLGI